MMINHGILMYPMDKTIFCLLDACALWFRMFFFFATQDNAYIGMTNPSMKTSNRFGMENY